MKKLQIKYSSQFLAIFLLVARVKSKKFCNAGDVTSQPFYITIRDISRLKEDIISELNVLSCLVCGTRCLKKSVCVGFNFKEKSKKNEINCQLTQTIDHKFERQSADDNGWTFYKAFGKRMFGCDKCLNGEQLIADPKKPLGCKCLKSGYVGQICEKCPLAFNFRGNDITQYGISRAPSQVLTSISVCFWISIPESYDTEPTVLSYGTFQDTNTFLLYFRPQLTLWMNKNLYSTGLSLNDGYFHHVCVTWESSNGDLKVYKDGTLVKKYFDIQTGTQIKGGGIWVIGQDQDTLGGGFDKEDSFMGIITQVNIWNRILGSDEMKSFDCGALLQGNNVAYSDFNITSVTESIKPTCCPLAPLL